MNAYIVSFLAGLLIGVIYYVMGVRSPAPPLVALVGLLGMVLGEAASPKVRAFLASKTQTETVTSDQDVPEKAK